MGIAVSILITITLLLSFGIGAAVFDYHSSDAAGNALTRAYTAIGAMVLWFLLGMLLLVCGMRGGMPGFHGLVALGLYGAAIAAQFVSLSILDRLPHHAFPEGWLRLVVAASPFLVIAHATAMSWPGLRACYTGSPLQAAAPAALAILSVIPWVVRGPYQTERNRGKAAVQQVADAAQSRMDEVRNLPDDTPLATLLAYTEGPGMFTTDLPEAARKRIRGLPARQAQAEALLEQESDLLLIQINTLELRVTPALCAAARKNLRRIAGAWQQANPDEGVAAESRPYQRSDRLIDPLRFLVRRGCDCKPEVTALTAALQPYPESFEKTFFLKKADALMKGEEPE